MTSILTDRLPTSIEVNGKKYPINSDFRYQLKTMMAFEDETLTGFEKQQIMLANLYRKMPNDISEASKKASLFFNGGKVYADSDEPAMRLYLFSKDANYIFAAFKQTHGIDLQIAKLHWWKFLAYFMDLGSDTTFCALVGMRKRVKTGKATKEEMQAAREMGDIFDIPDIDNRTLEEREREEEFFRLLKLGQK